MATRYVVTAPYVTMTTTTDEGPRVVGFYAGALVPEDVSDDSIRHHLDNNLIAEQGSDEAEQAGNPTAPPPTSPETPSPSATVPAKSANKPEWEAYAVSQGMSEDDASAATKEQLVDRYGG